MPQDQEEPEDEIDDELDGWGDSEDDDGLDSSKAAPFIYIAQDSSQVLIVPAALKEVKLPGSGKKGGCDDWQVRALKEKAADGSLKYVIESKGGHAASRHLDSILSTTKFPQPLSEESKSEMTRPGTKTNQFVLWCMVLLVSQISKVWFSNDDGHFDTLTCFFIL